MADVVALKETVDLKVGVTVKEVALKVGVTVKEVVTKVDVTVIVKEVVTKVGVTVKEVVTKVGVTVKEAAMKVGVTVREGATKVGVTVKEGATKVGVVAAVAKEVGVDSIGVTGLLMWKTRGTSPLLGALPWKSCDKHALFCKSTERNYYSYLSFSLENQLLLMNFRFESIPMPYVPLYSIVS